MLAIIKLIILILNLTSILSYDWFSELDFIPSWIIGLYDLNKSVCLNNKVITLFHLTSLVGGTNIISFGFNKNFLPTIRFMGFLISSLIISSFKYEL